MVSASEALRRLREGNARFVAGDPRRSVRADRGRRRQLVSGQHPFAVVLGCSDSRVPAELVFDQGLGDLFVIRIAGNFVAPAVVGSVELAGELLGTRLVVVLGHSGCGAVGLTLDELQLPSEQRSPDFRPIVERIRPAIEDLLAPDPGLDRDAVVRRAVRANVRSSADRLRHGSPLLERLADDGLKVLGAEYSLETGRVDFFDGLDALED